MPAYTSLYDRMPRSGLEVTDLTMHGSSQARRHISTSPNTFWWSRLILSSRSVRDRIACLLAAASIACASKPVEVRTAAIVTVDTSRHVAIRMRKAAPVKNFWGAMSNLDPDYPAGHPTTSDEQQFATALRMIMSGEPDEAELLLDSLRRNTGDSIVRSASHILMTATLQYQDKWKELADLSPVRPEPADSADRDRAGVELWAAAFKGVGPRRLSFPVNPVVVSLTLSVAGTPVIPVEINGKQKLFWLDTGSSMSIVASDVATECGLEALVSDTLEVATTTGRVAARPAAIRRLNIGGISIANSTAMIVAASLMEIRLGDPQNPARTVRIDGIIGFDIISRLNVQINYTRGNVRLSKPVRTTDGKAQRNLFWVGTPIVRVVTPGGIPMHLGLDTGAQETYASERMLDKIRVRTFIGERKRIGGFAGLREFRGRFISDLRVSLRGKNLLFQKLLVFAPTISTFVNLDGVLGSDIGRTGIVRIDAENGIFSVELPTM
jgi:hypothetical protein